MQLVQTHGIITSPQAERQVACQTQMMINVYKHVLMVLWQQLFVKPGQTVIAC